MVKRAQDVSGASRPCRTAEPTPADETSGAALQKMETLLSSGLAALRAVRPSFDALYAVLDDGQREALDDLLAHGSGL